MSADILYQTMQQELEALRKEVAQLRRNAVLMAEISGKAFFLVVEIQRRDYEGSPQIERLTQNLRDALTRYDTMFGNSTKSDTPKE
jgi:hypothetical protein